MARRPRTRKKRQQRLEEKGDRPARITTRKDRVMGFLSFVGRVLFASTFLLSAYQEASEFGSAAKSLEPKLNLFLKHVSNYTGMATPRIETKTVLPATLYVRAFGAGLFILCSSLGAHLLILYLAFISPVVYDFYNYEKRSPQFLHLHARFSENMALYGALLFFVGMKHHLNEELEEKDGKGQDSRIWKLLM